MEPVHTPLKRIGVAQSKGQLLADQKLLHAQAHKWPHAAKNQQQTAVKNLGKRQKPQTQANLQGKDEEMELGEEM